MNRLAKLSIASIVVCLVAVTLANRRGDAVFLGHFLKGDSVASETSEPSPPTVATPTPVPTLEETTIAATSTVIPENEIVSDIVLVGTPSPPPENSVTEVDQEVLTYFAEQYANDFAVTIEEALQRLQLQENVRELKKQLQEDFSDTFAGLWVQHEPAYQVHVLLTKADFTPVISYIADNSLSEWTTVEQVALSLEELQVIQEMVMQIDLTHSEIRFDHGINLVENRVEVYVTDVPAFQTAIQQAGFSLPDNTVVIEVARLSRVTTEIYAGLEIEGHGPGWYNNCTTGFTVLHNDSGTGTVGIITAGHCSCNDPTNPLTCTGFVPVYFGSILLPIQARIWDSSYDVEWHTVQGLTARNIVDDGSRYYIYGIVPQHLQFQGDYVCKYGRTTGADCGLIVDATFNDHFVRVHSDTDDLGDYGDSGGPWFWLNSAYGVMTGDFDGQNDAYYMPIDRVDILNLCVLQAESNPTAPSLSVTPETDSMLLEWTHNQDPCGYEIHRSETPYFDPTDSTVVKRVTWQAVGYRTRKGIGDAQHNYYYTIRAITGSSAPHSNRVGEFDFDLKPGS